MERLSILMRPFEGWRRRVAGAAALCVALGAGCALAAPLKGLGGSWLRWAAIPGVNWRENPAQVQIQQHLSIRISPGPPIAPPNLAMDMEQEDRGVHLEERRMGNCVPVSAVVGVQSAQGNRLLLFLRDTRVVSAMLEKSCRSTDYYSGFYVERNADGQICVERDKLHARSGANCKIRDLKALVEVSSRRFP
jgi:hypothetical protein